MVQAISTRGARSSWNQVLTDLEHFQQTDATALPLQHQRRVRIAGLVIHADTCTNVPHFTGKHTVERMIERLDIPATILRPAYLMQNEGMLQQTITDDGLYPMPIGAKGIAMIDARDIADREKRIVSALAAHRWVAAIAIRARLSALRGWMRMCSLRFTGVARGAYAGVCRYAKDCTASTDCLHMPAGPSAHDRGL